MLNNTLILLVKYIPIIHMVGMVLINTLCYLELSPKLWRILGLVAGGDTVFFTILLYVCSYVFNFGVWHRLIVLSNFFNITIAVTDVLFRLPVSNLGLLSLYYITDIVFLIIILIIRFREKMVMR